MRVVAPGGDKEKKDPLRRCATPPPEARGRRKRGQRKTLTPALSSGEREEELGLESEPTLGGRLGA